MDTSSGISAMDREEIKKSEKTMTARPNSNLCDMLVLSTLY